MKNLHKITFFFFLLLISCKEETNSVFPLTDYDTEMEMEKVSKEMNIFDDILNKLYRESEKNPKKTLQKIDSLFKANENEKDKYKSQIKENIADDLRMFKAELLYNICEYEKSIEILKIGTSGHDEIGLVCNYVKLKKFDKAKRILDSIPNYTFNTFIYANFYESIGKKDEALKIYKTIQKDKGINHFVYYKLAVERINELQKQNPILLNSIYYETGRPDFEVCDADNENRTKVIELVRELPEVKDKFEKNAGIGIVEAPKDNGKNYYWVRFYEDNSLIFKTEYNFFIYQKTFEIKYFDKKNNKVLSLAEWRKTK
jgi:tetratricopeptide (TPR) repeat protein